MIYNKKIVLVKTPTKHGGEINPTKTTTTRNPHHPTV